VFAAVVQGEVAALVDGELYLPQEWTKDAQRCEQTGIPDQARVFRTKGEMALAMVLRARRAGLNFAYTVFDGGYGHLPWLLAELDAEGERFLAEVHADQAIYLHDPCPRLPAPRSGKARARAQSPAETVSAWARRQPACAWRRLALRDGEKGTVFAEYLTARVYVRDGASAAAHHWHLLVRRELGGEELKFCLSNAKPKASLRQLATMQAARHFVERALAEAKGTCGMADYQVRRWSAWHHHMVLVMIALMFLAKQRLAHHDTAKLLSCRDIVEILHHRLPSKILTEDDLVRNLVERHWRREQAMKSAYRRQAVILAASS